MSPLLGDPWEANMLMVQGEDKPEDRGELYTREMTKDMVEERTDRKAVNLPKSKHSALLPAQHLRVAVVETDVQGPFKAPGAPFGNGTSTNAPARAVPW